MKTIKYICDRCGGEIDKLYRVYVNEVGAESSAAVSDMDFCEKCAKKILNFALSTKRGGNLVD